MVYNSFVPSIIKQIFVKKCLYLIGCFGVFYVVRNSDDLTARYEAFIDEATDTK